MKAFKTVLDFPLLFQDCFSDFLMPFFGNRVKAGDDDGHGVTDTGYQRI
jgi:hypothetical protein